MWCPTSADPRCVHGSPSALSPLRERKAQSGPRTLTSSTIFGESIKSMMHSKALRRKRVLVAYGVDVDRWDDAST